MLLISRTYLNISVIFLVKRENASDNQLICIALLMVLFHAGFHLSVFHPNVIFIFVVFLCVLCFASCKVLTLFSIYLSCCFCQKLITILNVCMSFCANHLNVNTSGLHISNHANIVLFWYWVHNDNSDRSIFSSVISLYRYSVMEILSQASWRWLSDQ